MTKHKPYTPEYKLSAVKLAQTEGVSKTAVNLGINSNMLARWKREHELGTSQARPVFTGKGNIALTEQEKENQQLRRELEIARQERDILKKALAFFAKETTLLANSGSLHQPLKRRTSP